MVATTTSELLNTLDKLCEPEPEPRPPPPPLPQGSLQWALPVLRYAVPLLVLRAFWPIIAAVLLACMDTGSAALVLSLLAAVWYLKCHCKQPVLLAAGFYHCKSSTRAEAIAHHMSAYAKEALAYRPPTWLWSGDLTTTIPFVLFEPKPVEFTRRWVENSKDGEVVAIDLAFPSSGFDKHKPVLLLLHGLNGGSDEGYIRDCTAHALSKGWTVGIFVARGLCRTQLCSSSVFSGVRISDFHSVVRVLSAALPPCTHMVACGYSMGAVVLGQYVSSALQTPLTAAVCISGTFHTVRNKQFLRSQELWQPILTYELKRSFARQWQHLVEACAETSMAKLYRCSSMPDWDGDVAAPLSGFKSCDEYYHQMSPAVDGRLSSIQVPTLSFSALDDPIIHGDTHREPAECDNPNLFTLLTAQGGHCGWPIGSKPSVRAWELCNRAVEEFCESVIASSEMQERPTCGEMTASFPSA